jgi:hypothetical protein
MNRLDQEHPQWMKPVHAARNRGVTIVEWVPVFLLSAARDPEQALANDPCQDADCEGLIGVNVYGSGARLVITVAL